MNVTVGSLVFNVDQLVGEDVKMDNVRKTIGIVIALVGGQGDGVESSGSGRSGYIVISVHGPVLSVIAQDALAVRLGTMEQPVNLDVIPIVQTVVQNQMENAMAVETKDMVNIVKITAEIIVQIVIRIKAVLHVKLDIGVPHVGLSAAVVVSLGLAAKVMDIVIAKPTGLAINVIHAKMGNMAQTVSYSAVKVVTLSVTKTLGIVTADLDGMDFSVTLNAVIVA